MKIVIKAPGLRARRTLKNYILEKIPRLEKLHDRIISAQVTLDREERKSGTVYNCSIILSLPGKDEFVKAGGVSFEDAVVQAIESAQRKLRIRKTQRLDERKISHE